LDRWIPLGPGQADGAAPWLDDALPSRRIACHLVILLGCGIYGATVGLWRSPLQGAYAAMKFPLLIYLTLAANAGLNGMISQLLGLGISFRQTFRILLTSFSIAALILASLAPVALFVLFNTPSLTDKGSLVPHLFLKSLHVFAIAFAGVAANVRLHRLLLQLAGDAGRARKILFGWLAGNLFLGSQIAWILRPFIGSPFLDVQFLRDDAFDGNFYENVFQTIQQLIVS
jgi:hypothetical protein